MFEFDFPKLILQLYEIYVHKNHLEKQYLYIKIYKYLSKENPFFFVFLTSQCYIIKINKNFMIIIENFIMFVVMNRTLDTSDHYDR